MWIYKHSKAEKIENKPSERTTMLVEIVDASLTNGSDCGSQVLTVQLNGVGMYSGFNMSYSFQGCEVSQMFLEELKTTKEQELCGKSVYAYFAPRTLAPAFLYIPDTE